MYVRIMFIYKHNYCKTFSKVNLCTTDNKTILADRGILYRFNWNTGKVHINLDERVGCLIKILILFQILHCLTVRIEIYCNIMCNCSIRLCVKAGVVQGRLNHSLTPTNIIHYSI